MDILVSFCNVFPGRPVLCLIDSATLAVRVVELPVDPLQHSGARGVCASEQYLYVAMQEGGLSCLRPPVLLAFDRKRLELAGRYEFRSTGDIHSLWCSGDALYAVSTGTDEVFEVEMRGAQAVAERVIWRPDPDVPRRDVHHLNAICEWRGDLLVSGFGKKESTLWASARDGFIHNITRGERLGGAIYNPHSLLPAGDTLFYCESKAHAVRVYGEGPRGEAPGYARGLCLAGGKVFVGTSVPRKISRSTGLVNPPEERGTGCCGVSRLSADSLALEHTVDLSAYGDEIYDLLAIEGTQKWPVIAEQRIPAIDALWREQARVAHAEIRASIPPGSEFVLLDEWTLEDGYAGEDLRRVNFFERDGQSWMPRDDSEAVEQVGALRQAGVSYLAFAWPSFWWFWKYAGFHRHLRCGYRSVLENDRLVIFDLGQPAA